jgi:integrase
LKSKQSGNIAGIDDNIVPLPRQRLIFQVDEGHRSKQTAEKYRTNFKYFLNYLPPTLRRDLQVLLDIGKEGLQEWVIKYTISLRDNAEKKYSRGTVNNRIASILYFLENNDIELNKRKIKRYFPSNESVNDDRPYTVEEIQRMLQIADLRTKAMVLLMASSGVRVGALHTMQIGDLTKIEFQNSIVYTIQVYARTRDKYLAFCTPECARAINEYLDYRRRFGEELKDKSPLFRKNFNKDDHFRINLPAFMTETAVIKSIVEGALKKSGVYKTSEIMRTHAYRKGFKTICEQSGMKSINVEMLLGHATGLNKSYYRPSESDLLQDYMDHAADALTISSEPKLRQQIKNKENEVKFIYEEISSLKRCVKHMTAEMKKMGYNTQETHEVQNSYDEYTNKVTELADSDFIA